LIHSGRMRRAASWLSAGRMRPAGRMLCTPALSTC